MSFLKHLLNGTVPLKEELQVLEPLELKKEEEHAIIARMKKMAKDAANYQFANALELVHQAYKVQPWEREASSLGDFIRPTPSDRKAWKQYEKFIELAVNLLAKYRGIKGTWRSERYDTIPTSSRSTMGSMAAARVMETYSITWKSNIDLGIVLENANLQTDPIILNDCLIQADLATIIYSLRQEAHEMGLSTSVKQSNNQAIITIFDDQCGLEFDVVTIKGKQVHS